MKSQYWVSLNEHRARIGRQSLCDAEKVGHYCRRIWGHPREHHWSVDPGAAKGVDGR